MTIHQELHERHQAALNRLLSVGIQKIEREREERRLRREAQERARQEALKTAREMRRRSVIERFESALEFMPRRTPTLLEIARLVCLRRGVTLIDLKSERRPRKVTDARKEFYYMARRRTTASWPKIARFCGGRDHTTALKGARRYAKERGLQAP